MISKVVLAKLSPTMDEGTIVSWNKAEGDPVQVGDLMAVIETDKANMEMEALGSGVVRKILVPAGTTAPVGSLIGVIADPDEDISAVLAEAAPPAPPVAAAPAAPAPAAPAPPAPAAPAPPAPAAPAPPAPAAPAPPAPAAPTVAPAPEAPPEPGRVKASPLARRMAAQQSVPLHAVSGSGPGGRIVKRDIEALVSGTAPGAAPGPASLPPALPAIVPGERIALSGMRKTIARRLTESKLAAPHYYVTAEIDMDKAVALREQVQAAQEKVSYTDFIIRACAKALPLFPMVNASWDGDGIVTHAEVHLGVAVALEDGLITPVVRNADRKGLLEIAREVRDLGARAREKTLRPEEYTGGTFTISNLGMLGVDEFTAIINPPESAILAVGAIRRIPVVDGEAIRPGHRMRVTMSSDHRIIDGAVAAQFLQEVRRLLENPISIAL